MLVETTLYTLESILNNVESKFNTFHLCQQLNEPLSLIFDVYQHQSDKSVEIKVIFININLFNDENNDVDDIISSTEIEKISPFYM